MIQKLKSLADKHKETIDQLSVLQRKVLDEELVRWKKAQQMACNGKDFKSATLDQIQQW